MKINKNYWVLGLLIFALSFSASSCSSSDDAADDGDATMIEPPPPVRYRLCVWNRSEFELHHVFIHAPDQAYNKKKSVLKTFLGKNVTLGVGESIILKVYEDDYRITVTRLKNKDGRLLAYTMGEPVTVAGDIRVEYLNNIFRESDIRKDIDEEGCPYDQEAFRYN